MKLTKFIQSAGLMTLSALGYIYIQMQIIDMAYQNNHFEKNILQLVETNGHITYEISQLKSASYLGIKMFKDNSDMQFANPDDVVQMASSEYFSDSLSTITLKEKGNLLARLFVSEAEAEVDINP